MNPFFPILVVDEPCDCYWCFLVNINPLWAIAQVVGEA